MLRPFSPARLAAATLSLLGYAALGCGEVAEVLRARSQGGAAGAAAGHSGVGAGGAATAGASAGGDGGDGQLPPRPELGLSLSSGQTHSCLASSGIVHCWGDNRDGQLGAGDTDVHLGPVRVAASGYVTQVSVGSRHSCWLDAAGNVSCFGSNAEGQLAQPSDVAMQATPAPVPLPGPARYLDVNYAHSCAILSSGELYCWGENAETQLGQGDAPDENQSTPVRVTDFADFVEVRCGQGHTLALRETGELLGWGRNTDGQIGLGEGTSIRIRMPTPLATSGAMHLEAGQDSACAVRGNGELICWGSSVDRHLGNGAEGPVWLPTTVSGLPPLSQVSSDTFHTCGLDEAGRAHCWGRAIEGQLGLGDNRRLQSDPIEVPSPVESGAWRSLAVGRFFTCGVTTDDRLWCTGANADRELGVADTERRNVFTEVALAE